jgi:hemoglobin/transferrin/lactoferrin receptor protein
VSTVGTLNLESSGSDITGSVNAVLHATRNVNVVVNINRGFRSPNIDDVSVYDERAEGTEVPSPGVKSVKLMTYEAGVKCETSRLSGSAFYYHNNINDLMERAAGLFNGLTFFDKNGNGLQDKGEVNILQRANIGDALIQGVELDFNYAPYSWLTVYGNYTWTKGEDTNADVPLARIPPDFGTVGVRWSSTARLAPWVELVCHAAGSQKKLNPADIADVRIGPNGTPGFSIFNVRSGVTLSKHFRFVLNLENILDEKYKYHGSGLYRPGFQVVTCAEIGL